MKILWVKSGDLLPLDAGGKIRSYHLLKQLARKHDVTLFLYYGERSQDTHKELEREFGRVICCRLRLPKPGSLGDVIGYVRNLFSLRPYSVGKYARRDVLRTLRQLVCTETFDILVCDYAQTADVIPWDIPCPKVIFTHNVEAQIWRRHYQVSSNALWKAVSWREYWAMARMERCALKRAHRILTVSETDRDFFAEFVDRDKIAAIPTGVDENYFRPGPESEQSCALVFTGSMDWSPNEDAILYFAEQILPRIRSRVPEASLWVVGRKPSPRLYALAQIDTNIHVTGRVDDIRPYLSKAAVYVVPLRIGGGTRIKIFEAMAAGKAVVSTSIGAEGLPVTHMENIVIADEPEEFALRVVTLLKDVTFRRDVGLAARKLVEQEYTWTAAADSFEKALVAAVENYSLYATPVGSIDCTGESTAI